jgi:hypothetical protein
MPVLLQYAVNDGPITLYNVWKEPIRKTLALIEEFCEDTIVGFNLAFDWFQIVKTYTIFRLCNPDWSPQEHINEIAAKEMEGRDGPCVKPASALDLMLHSRKGPYQSLMARDDIRIRKVPTALAYALAMELENRLQLDGIYFARSKNKDAPKWQVFDRINRKKGVMDPDFKDVVLKFNPAGGLKFLAEYAMGFEPKFHYHDVEPPRYWYPMELGYAPFAAAISSQDKNWEVWGFDKKKNKPVLEGHAWPGVIDKFIEHWATHEDAREYARDDIVYTRALDEYFGFPEPGDNDSILATMVPVVRWRGFRIDTAKMQALRDKAQLIVDAAPINTNKPSAVRAYLEEVMDDAESLRMHLPDSTDKKTLEKIVKMEVTEDEPCLKCFGTGCARCDGTGELKAGKPSCNSEKNWGNHPAAFRAKEVLDVKFAKKEVELYDKLLLAGRFHASFVVVGTKSSRMAGDGGLNAQGIKKTKDVRRCFPLAWDGYTLCGGDFDSFEVTLADAVYNDPALRKELVTKAICPDCGGTKINKKKKPCDECDENGMARQKIHALFGMILYNKTYEEILASSGTDNDMYTRAKQGIFAMIYGGQWDTLVKNCSISEDVARAAYDGFGKKYPGIARARERTLNMFCSMRQPGGPGTQVVWNEPADYVESFLGFRRYFTLENLICRALFELANNTPKAWKKCSVKVWRRDRVQTAGGAVSSALYGAAFGIQAANMRAAGNHEIQSPGGEITKDVQRNIWDLQPAGIHDLMVAPMNVHDEIMCVTHPGFIHPVTDAVRTTVESYRDKVPLIAVTWNEVQDNWADKKGGTVTVKVQPLEMMAA